MIATYEELNSFGFNVLDKDSKVPSGKILWYDNHEVGVIARERDDGKYEISRVRDQNYIYHNTERLASFAFKTLGDLISYFRRSKDKRWKNVDHVTRELMFEIAETPAKEKDDSEHLADIVYDRIKSNYQDAKMRDRLEWMLDAAITSHILGEPERFIAPKTP